MNQVQQQQKKQKRYNENQRIRRIQYFKRKHRKSNMEEIVEQDPSLPMSLSSSSTMTKKTFYPLHIISNMEPSAFLSNYSMMSTTSFKQMLSTHSTINLHDELLDSDEKIIFTRQLFELTNKVKYFKLQEEQWLYYYHLGVTQGSWTGRVSKKMALINSMCYTYGRQKTLIEQRRKYFKQQLEDITTNDFVDQDQYQMRVEFERRQHILQYDAKDHRLVETFYQLQPRQTEIHSAKIIWKAAHDEQVLRYEIAIFKNWFFSTNRSPICSIQDLALKNMNDIITHLIFDKQLTPTTAATTSHKTCSIETFIETIAQQTISTTEAIAQQYVQTVNDQKQKTLHNRGKFKKPPTVDIIIAAIENRQINMVQRVEYNIEQQTKYLMQQNINKTTQLHYN